MKSLSLALAATFALVPAPADATTVSTVASKIDVPWAVAFLPDRTALVTERNTGRVLSVKGRTVREVAKIPGVQAGGEGGLLGIAVSPRYTADRYVFVYYTTEHDNRVARLRIGGAPEPVVTGIPAGGYQIGGRIAFGPDGHLYLGTGDVTNGDDAQNPASLAGKILRVTTEGKPAPGNPVPGSPVYSLGHRNVQGFTWDAKGRMYASELGQQEFDEVNRILPGRNYGWPVCEGRCGNAKFTDPLVTWTVDKASPSGMAFYRNSLYVTALRGERVWKVPVKSDGTLGKPASAFTGNGRLRDAVATPDGKLWLTTSNRDGNGAGEPGPNDDRVLATSG
ncbi:PQQ-dependent sugar dehydrogenase [Amycolatopsis suaedae]|uniref:PQQ-dependent sugar dehydrogenase n=1 Tax=Amycolatopsis suaedae TaxID=2510978 RepID=A0A4Q7JCH4_9PSEU|nr:PQQ-dependent sugar dehydrogenase [Amycolatopsis suaedae]RZQ64243.1 PQQ-dependent sugar dehydrogenase [Amycolatopsis suaedae]